MLRTGYLPKLGRTGLFRRQNMHTINLPASGGDLNNVSAMRFTKPLVRDPDFAYRSLAISEEDDDPDVRLRYRPYLLPAEPAPKDWVSGLELATVTKMAYEDFQRTLTRPKILVLYGSLRQK